MLMHFWHLPGFPLNVINKIWSYLLPFLIFEYLLFPFDTFVFVCFLFLFLFVFVFVCLFCFCFCFVLFWFGLLCFCFCLFVCLFVLFLFCFVLFCFVLFCFVLFCFVLFCFVLLCFVFCEYLKTIVQDAFHLDRVIHTNLSVSLWDFSHWNQCNTGTIILHSTLLESEQL